MADLLSRNLYEILTKAVTDDQFREDLRDRPDQALAPYALDPADRAILDKLDPKLIEGFATQLKKDAAPAAAMVAMAVMHEKP